jgi:DNA-binding response OmpR family regulator
VAVEREPVGLLVVSDDATLGGLIARNLRLRGLAAEDVAPLRALQDDWRPASGTPRLIIVSIEVPERASRAEVERLLRRPWAAGVPCLLAIERSSRLAQQAGAFVACPLVPPYDIGVILAAARALLAHPLPA